MIIALLVTQIVAMPCSILFGRASGKFSSIKLILFAIAMYLVICVLGFYMGFHVEQAELSKRRPSGLSKRPSLFPDPFLDHGGAGRYGSGGASRRFPVLISASWCRRKIQRVFRLFRYFWKIRHSYGPAIVALISGLTGRDSIGVLSVSVLFLIGGGLLIGFRSHFTAEAAERSKQAAKNDAG